MNESESLDGSKANGITDLSMRREAWIRNEACDWTDRKADGQIRREKDFNLSIYTDVHRDGWIESSQEEPGKLVLCTLL